MLLFYVLSLSKGHTFKPVYEELERECDTLSHTQEINQDIIESQQAICTDNFTEIECIPQRGNNERLLPTDEVLADKNFSIGLWAYLQTVSKCNQVDDFRYVASKDVKLGKDRAR